MIEEARIEKVEEGKKGREEVVLAPETVPGIAMIGDIEAIEMTEEKGYTRNFYSGIHSTTLPMQDLSAWMNLVELFQNVAAQGLLRQSCKDLGGRLHRHRRDLRIEKWEEEMKIPIKKKLIQKKNWMKKPK
jgi:hypothetical protein